MFFSILSINASELKKSAFEEELYEPSSPLQQFWHGLMNQGLVTFDISHIRNFEEFFDLLFGMEEEDENMGMVIDTMLKQLNMKKLIVRRQDSNEFLKAAAKRGNSGAIREILGYCERLKPHNWAVLRSFEDAASYNQTHIMNDFLNLRFGKSYVLMEDNIGTALVYAKEKSHAEAIELLESYPRHPSIPYPFKSSVLENQKLPG